MYWIRILTFESGDSMALAERVSPSRANGIATAAGMSSAGPVNVMHKDLPQERSSSETAASATRAADAAPTTRTANLKRIFGKRFTADSL